MQVETYHRPSESPPLKYEQMHVFHRVLQLLHKIKQLLSCLAPLYAWARAKHFDCHSVCQCSMIIHVVSMFPIATLCYYYRRRDHAP